MKGLVQKLFNAWGLSIIRTKSLLKLRTKNQLQEHSINIDFALFMSTDKITFPLYVDDGIANVELEDTQQELVRNFNDQLHFSERYKHIENICLCGNSDKELDLVVTEKDRYGIAIPSVLCRNCSLVRSQFILSPESAANFYRDFFVKIYRHSMHPEKKFQSRIRVGEQKIALLKKHVELEEISTVFEVGCSSGGVIFPFLELGKTVGGCDYDDDYIQYGIEKGLDLYTGPIDDRRTPDNTIDLLVLEHVLEHFLDPMNELETIINKVKPLKFLLIEIPSLMNIAQSYKNPIKYFQNAHTFCFFKKYLEAIFDHFGLNIIYADETSIFILQKPVDWIPPEATFRGAPSLQAYSSTIETYLKFSFLRWNSINNSTPDTQKWI